MISLVAATGSLLLSGCAAPSERFVVSDDNTVVVKLPRSWAQVRSGPPDAGPDGTVPAGVPWVAVFDAAEPPDVDHVRATSTPSPVALVQTWEVTATVGAGVTDDDLRDIVFPVSDAGRAKSAAEGNSFVATFALIENTPIVSKQASGVRVVYSYDLGAGVEVFTKVAMIDTARTHVHALYIHCTQTCWQANRTAIDAAARSFTVKGA